MIHGFAAAYQGVGAKANQGFYYLNPFLSTSRRVFGELNSDQANLEGLVVDAAGLTSTLDAKSPEISSLVSNLNGMLGTIGAQQQSLASAVGQLPDFMRQFNTTAVNLRAALDDVQPLINATRPVAPQAPALRQAAARLRPRLRADGQGPQRRSSRRPGAANDLIELTRLQDPLAKIGVGPVDRNGASRPGALPASADSLKDSLDQISTLRAYGPELTRLVRRLRALRLPGCLRRHRPDLDHPQHLQRRAALRRCPVQPGPRHHRRELSGAQRQ